MSSLQRQGELVVIMDNPSSEKMEKFAIHMEQMPPQVAAGIALLAGYSRRNGNRMVPVAVGHDWFYTPGQGDDLE